MKVKCIKLENDSSNEKTDGWITLGKEYHVLSMVYDHHIKYRVIASDSTPIMIDSSFFSIVDNKIPSNWVVNDVKEDYLVLGPESWSANSFWERFFDGDELAIDIYHEELKLILQ